MPTIINADDVKIYKGEGWAQLTLADAELIGAPAMVARRWRFEPGATGPELVQGDRDQLLYVIRGSGQVLVNGQSLTLTGESVLWVEPGERYQFVAGPEGLDILQGYAPGE